MCKVLADRFANLAGYYIGKGCKRGLRYLRAAQYLRQRAERFDVKLIV